MFASPSSDVLPAPRAPVRGSALALLAAAVACGYGVAALALALTMPPAPPDAEFSPPPPAPAAIAPEPPPARDWPALFGLPPPPAPAEPPPAPAAETDPEPEPEPIPPLDARLRGLAMDESGGWALIDLDGRVVMARPGSSLDGHRRVAEILPDGVRLDGPDGPELLAFADEPGGGRIGGREGGQSSVRESLARSYLRGEQGLFDLPVPLPPPDYVAGPGFLGPND
jgi:hypothetical protein